MVKIESPHWRLQFILSLLGFNRFLALANNSSEDNDLYDLLEESDLDIGVFQIPKSIFMNLFFSNKSLQIFQQEVQKLLTTDVIKSWEDELSLVFRSNPQFGFIEQKIKDFKAILGRSSNNTASIRT